MRLTELRWLSFAACLLAATCSGCPARPPAKAAKAVEQKVQSVPDKKSQIPSWPEQGWGKTLEDAEKHAAQNAAVKVASYLKNLDAQWAWLPPGEFVRKNLLNSTPQRCPEQDMVVKGEQVQCWSWTVSLPAAQLENMRREDAKYRIQLAVLERSVNANERMTEMAKLVVLLVLVLSGVWLYIRVDQWIEGSGRHWVRLGLASLVLGGGVGLWLLS